MDHSFEQYKKTSDEVMRLLIKNRCASQHDINIIYHMLMNFPCCMDSEGHYTYGGEMYDDPRAMPEEAKHQLIWHYKQGLPWADLLN